MQGRTVLAGPTLHPEVLKNGGNMFDKAHAEFFGTTARQTPREDSKPEVPLYWYPKYQEWLSLDAAKYRKEGDQA